MEKKVMDKIINKITTTIDFELYIFFFDIEETECMRSKGALRRKENTPKNFKMHVVYFYIHTVDLLHSPTQNTLLNFIAHFFFKNKSKIEKKLKFDCHTKATIKIDLCIPLIPPLLQDIEIN